jgi:hypothetical protein
MATAARGLFGGGSSVNTTNATPITIVSFTVAEAVRLRFEGELIGWCAATDEICILNFSGGARRAVAGNVNVPAGLLGSAGGAEGSIAGCSVQISTTAPDTVNVQAVGIAAKTITWNCLGRTVEQT